MEILFLLLPLAHKVTINSSCHNSYNTTRTVAFTITHFIATRATICFRGTLSRNMLCSFTWYNNNNNSNSNHQTEHAFNSHTHHGTNWCWFCFLTGLPKYIFHSFAFARQSDVLSTCVYCLPFVLCPVVVFSTSATEDEI